MQILVFYFHFCKSFLNLHNLVSSFRQFWCIYVHHQTKWLVRRFWCIFQTKCLVRGGEKDEGSGAGISHSSGLNLINLLYFLFPMAVRALHSPSVFPAFWEEAKFTLSSLIRSFWLLWGWFSSFVVSSAASWSCSYGGGGRGRGEMKNQEKKFLKTFANFLWKQASKHPLLLLGSKNRLRRVGFFGFQITSLKKYILESTIHLPFSVEKIHLRDAFQMHFSTPSPYGHAWSKWTDHFHFLMSQFVHFEGGACGGVPEAEPGARPCWRARRPGRAAASPGTGWKYQIRKIP